MEAQKRQDEEQKITAQMALMNAIAEMKKLPSARDVSVAITQAETALLWLRSSAQTL